MYFCIEISPGRWKLELRADLNSSLVLREREFRVRDRFDDEFRAAMVAIKNTLWTD